MLKKLTTAALAAAAITLVTSGAQAAVLFNTSGTNSFAFNTNGTNVTTDVTTTPAFPLIGSDIAPTTSTGSFSMVTLPATLSLTGGIDFTNVNTFGFTDAGLGTFVATSIIKESSPANTAIYEVLGTFTLNGSASDWTNPSTTQVSADEIWTLGQTGGAGNSINISGTFHAPAAFLAPEPITISLFGAGLVGVGFGARRRKKAPKA